MLQSLAPVKTAPKVFLFGDSYAQLDASGKAFADSLARIVCGDDAVRFGKLVSRDSFQVKPSNGEPRTLKAADLQAELKTAGSLSAFLGTTVTSPITRWALISREPESFKLKVFGAKPAISAVRVKGKWEIESVSVDTKAAAKDAP
jgi:hypothetical protein